MDCIPKPYFVEREWFVKTLKELTQSPLNSNSEDESLKWRNLLGTLGRFQETPSLLDASLEDIISPAISVLLDNILKAYDSNEALSQEIWNQIYPLYTYFACLCNVRGYKTVLRFLPHEVDLIEPLFEYLISFIKHSQDNPDLNQKWEIPYFLLLWLSLVLLAPYDISKFDSRCDELKMTLSQRLLNVGKSFLSLSGKQRDAAALFLARLLVRVDHTQNLLPQFIEWCVDTLQNLSDSHLDGILALGMLSTLSSVYKLGNRDLLKQSLLVINPIIKSSSLHKLPNTVIRKQYFKLIQRIALCILPPYLMVKVDRKRGIFNLKQITNQTGSDDSLMHSKEIFEVAVEVELVIGKLLDGLSDRDTIVRWSCAKGVGRICSRLPVSMGNEVISAILRLFSENTSKSSEAVDWTDKVLESEFLSTLDISAVDDSTWHGCCLAIAELARSGVLSPSRLEDILPWLLKCLRFDQKKGSHSIGTHVRDAACYVCWSFARSFSSDKLKPFVETLASSLVVISIYDREVTVRRACSAAFQENVGRQGNFPNGIELITAADFFNLGNRNNSFLVVSEDVARLGTYSKHMIYHLCTISLQHWDYSMRELAATALGILTKYETKYFLEVVIPYLLKSVTSNDICIAHGSILALGEVLLAFSVLEKTDTSLVIEVIKTFNEIPLSRYSSFGSELLVEAGCHFISCLSQVIKKGSLQVQPSFFELFEIALDRQEESLHYKAATAFAYFSRICDVQKMVLENYLRKANTTTNILKNRKGYILFLGVVNYCQWQDSNVMEIFRCLLRSISEKGELVKDVEHRKCAIEAIQSIFLLSASDIYKAVTPDLFHEVLSCLIISMTDYTVDSRGDIGSCVREASMQCLSKVIIHANKFLSPESLQLYWQQDQCNVIIGKILRQAVEKINRLREIAASAMHFLLYAEEGLRYLNTSVEIVPTNLLTDLSGTKVTLIANREKLEQAFPRGSKMNYLNTDEVLPVIIPLIMEPKYSEDMLLGLVACTGGLTESLAKSSSNTFVAFLDNLSEESKFNTKEFAKLFLKVFKAYLPDPKITFVMLNTLQILMETCESWRTMKISELYYVELEKIVEESVTRCKNVGILLIGIKVLCGIAGCPFLPARKKSFHRLLRFLIHPMPTIRRAVAEELYQSLTSYIIDIDGLIVEDENENQGEIEAILLNTKWDDNVMTIRGKQKDIMKLIMS